MKRRTFIRQGGLLASGLALPSFMHAISDHGPDKPRPQSFPPRPAFPGGAGRPPLERRCFTSAAVEARIEALAPRIANPELARLFRNCYPNTLDTTVTLGGEPGDEDTFVITGDIPAMWLRDSAAQTLPYVDLAPQDEPLRRLFRGLLRRQAACVLLDPYANAFYQNQETGEFRDDETEMKPGIHERKWEIDSLCYPLRLAHAYWRTTADRAPFDHCWLSAARLILETFQVQQRLPAPGPYRFARKSDFFYDHSPNGGRGNPTRKIGLIHSAFRPSDDGCFYPFLIPSNFFAEAALRQLAELVREIYREESFATECLRLADTLKSALAGHATCDHPIHGRIFAFEVDGFGNALMMDDANIPSLLSLPYLGACGTEDPVYRRTRGFVLSPDNPYFHRGRLAEGVGGPHVAPTMIWPLSIIMRARTSRDESEIVQCLRMLAATHAGTGFMHESFDPDDPAKFSRPWFAWCNSQFGELIVHLSAHFPETLKEA